MMSLFFIRHPISRAAGLIALSVALAGCVYRPDIQQGNFLELKDVDQVTEGMTRSQVRYLLGTPMISDPFEAQRWDYVYTLKRGRSRKIDRSHFVVYFADDKVTKVDKLDLPENTSVSGRKKSKKEMKKDAEAARKAAEAKVHEPPTPPPVTPAQPDAPRPGSERY
jgi:outer membrane protein assembly factor BamE